MFTPLVIYALNINDINPFLFILLKLLFFSILILILFCLKYIIFKGIKWIFYFFEWKDVAKIILVGLLQILLMAAQQLLIVYLNPALYEKIVEESKNKKIEKYNKKIERYTKKSGTEEREESSENKLKDIE